MEEYVTRKVHFWESNGLFETSIMEKIQNDFTKLLKNNENIIIQYNNTDYIEIFTLYSAIRNRVADKLLSVIINN